jgi:hypothetical protein
MPDKRRLAPVRWRGAGVSGGTSSSDGPPSGPTAGSRSTEQVVAANSITGVTPFRMVLSAGTTSTNSITLPWPGSVVGISFYGGATGGGVFSVYVESILTAATLTWDAASTGDSATFAAGTVPFDAGDVMNLVSSNTQTADVYVYVTFLS